jgi:hypothetical protein
VGAALAIVTILVAIFGILHASGGSSTSSVVNQNKNSPCSAFGNNNTSNCTNVNIGTGQ